METWVQQAIDQWKKEGIELKKGVSSEKFQWAEAQIGFVFPEDFKKLYSVVNGFVDFEMRGFMLSLWSLERIVDNYQDKKGFIMFSDHSISVCQYGFSKIRQEIFKSHTHNQYGPIDIIAQSFQQMIELFNCDSELLF